MRKVWLLVGLAVVLGGIAAIQFVAALAAVALALAARLWRRRRAVDY